MNSNQYEYTFTFHRYSDGCKIEEKAFVVKQVSPEHPARTAINLATKHAESLANQRQQRITVAEVHANALWHIDPKITEETSLS